jgi:hypothetical protein
VAKDNPKGFCPILEPAQVITGISRWSTRSTIGKSEYLVSQLKLEVHIDYIRYHDENTKEADLTHPEDIAHFKLHDDLEDEADRQAELDKMSIVEENIPSKFRRDQV